MTSESKSNEKLELLRTKLRTIDDEIVRCVVRRMEIVKDIGSLKRAQGIEILDTQRETFNKDRSRGIANGKIPSEMVDELTDLLAEWARDIQSQMR